MKLQKRIPFLLILILSTVFMFTSCKNLDDGENKDEEVFLEETKTPEIEDDENDDTEDDDTSTFPITLTDHAGRKVTIEKKAEKLVSGYYISSYGLISLGLQDKVVGIENKPETRPFYEKFAPEMAMQSQIGTRKEVNIEEIVSLEPDLVILPNSLVDSADMLEEIGITTIIVNPENFDQYKSMIDMIAKATETIDRATELNDFYDDKMKEFDELAKLVETDSMTKAYISSSSAPLRAASKDMFQVGILENAKINYVGNDIEGDSWVDVSIEQVIAYNPEIIFIASQPDFDIDEITNNDQWAEIDAVKNKNVFVIPSNIDNWESPSYAMVPAAYWMLSKAYSEIVPENKVEEIATEYYKLFFNYDISEEELGL